MSSKSYIQFLLIISIMLLGACDLTKKEFVESERDRPQTEASNSISNAALRCFKALDEEETASPVPYFPYISLQANKLEEWGQEVKAPYEYVLYRYWTNRHLDKGFSQLASFRTNPIWTSDTMDISAIVPVFSDESRRLFYKDSGYVENPVELTVFDEDSYYSERGSFLARLIPEPEGGAGGPAPSNEIVNACSPLLEKEPAELYPFPVGEESSDSQADLEWNDGIYPFRNVISLFTGSQEEYFNLYDNYVLAYHTDHSKLMNIVAHVYSKNDHVSRVWMEYDGVDIDLQKSDHVDLKKLNAKYWTFYDAEVTSELFDSVENMARVFVELDSGEIKELFNM